MKRWVHVHTRGSKKARIEIIPMIDTIFFLLVFFMFTSLSMVQMKGMGVSLPKDAQDFKQPPPVTVVTVNRDGDYLIGLDKIEPSQLGSLLQQRVTEKPDTVIIVNVDPTQSVQTIISVMDAINDVKTPDGQPATVSIAKQPVDAKGQVISGPGKP